MTRILVLAAVAAIVAGCGSSGPVYRGAPPDGMTDAEYRCKLQPERCQNRRQPWPDMVEPGLGGQISL